MLGGPISGGIPVVSGAADPTHYHNGLPYEGAGLAISPDPIDHYHQGLPFTANGRLSNAVAQVTTRFGSGAAPFDAADQLSMNLGATDYTSFGVPYTADNQIHVELVP